MVECRTSRAARARAVGRATMDAGETERYRCGRRDDVPRRVLASLILKRVLQSRGEKRGARKEARRENERKTKEAPRCASLLSPRESTRMREIHPLPLPRRLA
jgi:hypothetical protein